MGDPVRRSGVSLASDLANVTIAGAHTADRVGMSASAGDADGDGYDDVLLGSPNFQAESRDVGRAYRFAGPIVAGTTLATAESWQGRLLAVPDASLRDSTSAEKLGSDVAQYGDFDGDGYADALISAPGDFIPLGGRRVRLVFGGTRALP